MWQVDFVEEIVLETGGQIDETDLVLSHFGGRHH